jgi:hypothetical protein
MTDAVVNNTVAAQNTAAQNTESDSESNSCAADVDVPRVIKIERITRGRWLYMRYHMSDNTHEDVSDGEDDPDTIFNLSADDEYQ